MSNARMRHRQCLIGIGLAVLLGAVAAGTLGVERGVRLLDIAVILDVALVLPAMCWLFHASGLRWN